jgi:hypothetical protein
MIEEEVTGVLLQLHKSFSFSMCYDLSEAYHGIQNLIITYQGDRDSVYRLCKCTEAIEKYLQSVGHFNLLELKKNATQGVWKKLNLLFKINPNLINSKWMKELLWKSLKVSCVAGGTILEPLLEDEKKRTKALKFIGPLALKYLLFQYYSKTKVVNLFLKVIMFSISQI